MKLLDIVGARPQFIKVGPILRAIDTHNHEHPQYAIHEILVHTGQHYDYGMSKVFFEELQLREPDYHPSDAQAAQLPQSPGEACADDRTRLVFRDALAREVC